MQNPISMCTHPGKENAENAERLDGPHGGQKTNPQSVIEEYYALKMKRCHPNRAGATRASSIGHPCTALIAFERIAGEQAEHVDKKLACIFSEGNLQEQAVLIDLQNMGYRITEGQRTIHWSKYEISGHIDGYISKEGMPPILIEIKSCSPFAFAKFNTAEDVKNAKKYFYRKWIAQLNVYMLLESLEVSWLILKNKATGELKIIEVRLDLEFAETLIKKAESVKYGVFNAQAEPPNDWADWLKASRLNDPEICLSCPFKSICLPSIDAGAGVYFSEDGEVAADLKEREACEVASHRFKELDEDIKAKAKRIFDAGSKEIICGDFVISGKKIEPKGKNPYWKVDISMIGSTDLAQGGA